MTRNQHTLALPLFVLSVVLLAAAGAVKFTRDKAQEAQQRLTAQQAQLRDAYTRVQKSGMERQLIIRYLPGYRQLATIGFVGEEQRINWLDALRVANQKGDLFGVNYELSPRRHYPLASTLSPGQMNIMQSVMRLQFQMLHEGDLPKFLELLSSQKAGLFLVDQCSLKRISSAQSMRYQPNLAADCLLSWITAQPQAPSGTPP